MPSREAILKEISDAKKRLVPYWEPRNKAMELSRKMRDLDPAVSILESKPPLPPGVARIIDSTPQDFWEWVVAMMAKEEIKYRVPPQFLPQKMQDKGPHIEKFSYAIDQNITATNIQNGIEPWHFLLAEQFAGSWYSVFPDCRYIKGSKAPVFSIDFWDPITVYPEPGRQSLSRVLRVWKTTLGEARALVNASGESIIPAGRFNGDDKIEVEITNYWVKTDDGVFNAMLIGNKGQENLVYDLLPQLFYDAIPVLIGPIDGRGNESWSGGSEQTVENLGHSVLDPGLRQMRQYNLLMTLIFDHSRQGVFANTYTKTQEGEGIDDEDVSPLPPGKISNPNLKVGEEVGYIIPPDLGPEIWKMADTLYEAIQRAYIPKALYGVNIPNFSSNVLQEALSEKALMHLSRRWATLDIVHQRIMVQILRKFRAMKGEIHLEGNHLEMKGISKGQRAGDFAEDFTWKDVPEQSGFLRIWRDTASPVDKNMVATREATLVERRIHSIRTAQEEMGVEDPEAETRQWERELAHQSPEYQDYIKIVGLRSEIEELRQKAVDAKADNKDKEAAGFDYKADLLEERMSQSISAPNSEQPKGVEAQPSSETIRTAAGGKPSVGGRPQLTAPQPKGAAA